jgi:hypothetical protein
MLRVIPVLAVCAMSQTALAQAVYKCTIAGTVEYRDQPCPGGVGTTLRVPVASAAPVASIDTARREREREREAALQAEKLRLAREVQTERLARAEARERRSADTQRRKCAKLRLHAKWANEDRAHLGGAKAEAARLKARRDAEVLAVECPA